MALSIANMNLPTFATTRNTKPAIKAAVKPGRPATRRALADLKKRNSAKEEVVVVKDKILKEEVVVVKDKIPEQRVQPLPEVPKGVKDIDAEEEGNPALCTEYAPLMYKYLLQLEKTQFIRKDFLKGCTVTGKMRGVLLDWLIEVHQQFKLLQETLYMTIFLIDRYLQAEGRSVKRDQLQLVGVTSMFIACKVEEMYAPELNDFVYITDNAYSAAAIRRMELKILQTLDFELGRPLPLHFLRRYSKAGDVDVLQHTLAKYIVELAQVEYELASLPPSLLAAGGLYLSLIVLTPDSSITELWSRSLEYYSEYAGESLLPTVCRLAVILYKAEDSKLKAVHGKYSLKRVMKVAEMSCLKSPIVHKLASKHLNSLR